MSWPTVLLRTGIHLVSCEANGRATVVIPKVSYEQE